MSPDRSEGDRRGELRLPWYVWAAIFTTALLLGILSGPYVFFQAK